MRPRNFRIGSMLKSLGVLFPNKNLRRLVNSFEGHTQEVVALH
jgi:hypothetical protein